MSTIVACVVNGTLMMLAARYGGWVAWFCVLGGYITGSLMVYYK